MALVTPLLPAGETPLTLVIAYFATLLPMLLLDMLWLGVMASRLYRPTLGDMALDGVRWAPAILFYLLYPVGLVIFAVAPALKLGGVGSALLQGALFGLFAYATYDLTNHATLRLWSWTFTLVDIGWGSLLSGASAAIACWLCGRLAS